MYIRGIHESKRKVYRPEFEVEYASVLPPVFSVIWALIKLPKRITITLTVGELPVAKIKYFVIPKIKFVKIRR